MRAATIIVLGSCLVAAPLHAATVLRTCDQAKDQADAPDDIEAHRLFTLPPYDLEHPTPGQFVLTFNFNVDAQGRPVCAWGAWPSGAYDDADSQQKTLDLRRQAVAWRYKPFLIDGKPAAAQIGESVPFPATLRTGTMPQAPLFSSQISLQRIGCFGSCPNYTVIIHGDGRVDYKGGQYTDVQGQHHWTISPGAVASLIERFRSAGIGQMHDNYRWAATDLPTYKLRLNIGGQSRFIVDYGGNRIGMPETVTDAENEVDRVSGADGMITLSGGGLRQLEDEHFAFNSPAGADILTRSLADENVGDDVILSLLDHGTPIMGGHAADPVMDYGDPLTLVSALDTALTMGREGVVQRLIADGALTDDQQQIDSAFQSAILSGRLNLVERLWAYHPSLTFMQKSWREGSEEGALRLPVSLLLDRGGAENDTWQDFDIAKFLIDKGCDINARNTAGNGLLHIAANSGNREFVQWLLVHGADIHTVNHDNEGPLNATFDEDVALDLLKAGADPTVEPENTPNFFFYAQNYGWTKVVDWLTAHGFAAQLAANMPPKTN